MAKVHCYLSNKFIKKTIVHFNLLSYFMKAHNIGECWVLEIKQSVIIHTQNQERCEENHKYKLAKK